MTHLRTTNSSLFIGKPWFCGSITIPGWSMFWGITSSPKERPICIRVNTMRSFILDLHSRSKTSVLTGRNGGNDQSDQESIYPYKGQNQSVGNLRLQAPHPRKNRRRTRRIRRITKAMIEPIFSISKLLTFKLTVRHSVVTFSTFSFYSE